MYALNLGDKNEVLSVCKVLKFTPESMPRVDTLPENVIDYDYTNGVFVLNEERQTARLAAIAAEEEAKNAVTQEEQNTADIQYLLMLAGEE